MSLPKGFKSYYVFLDEEMTAIQYSVAQPDAYDHYATWAQARKRVIEHLNNRAQSFRATAKSWKGMTEEQYGIGLEWEPEE